MNDKRLYTEEKARGLAALRSHVEDLLGRGKTRDAVDAAKRLYKETCSSEAEALLVDAYAARTRALMATGMSREARDLDEVIERARAGIAAGAEVVKPGITFCRNRTLAAPATSAPEGTKFDGGKLRTDLLPVDVVEGWARVLTHGASKYTDRNWEQGMAWHRAYGAALRHLFAFWRGEDIDTDSGLPHIDCALCEIAFLSAYQKRSVGTDDRPISTQ